MKKVALLGCTGSIGTTAVKVLRKYKTDFQVTLLANFSQESELHALQKLFPEAKTYCFSTAEDKEFLSREETYSDVDIVVNGIAGLAGLMPSYASLSAGKILATANKESLVCAGNILKDVMKKTGGKIRPVDSEHSAVWQCIDRDVSAVKKIILTASGGAFRDYTKEQLVYAKAEKALCHPNWKMGKKVTIDCATLVNKGMEIIEAKRLFGVENVTALRHDESIIHAMVQTKDNAFLAALSSPDMILPVQYALFYPERKECDIKELDWEKVSCLHFSPIDTDKFPAYLLCLEAEKRGDVGGTVLNATDEVLVRRYLEDKCAFYDVSHGIEKALNKFAGKERLTDIQDVFRMDKEVREYILSDCCS